MVGVPDPRLGRARRASSTRERISAGDGVVRRHRRASSGAPARGRAWATSSSPTSASPTRSARWSGPSPTPTWSTSTARSRPTDDIETINTELILADLQTVEKALPRLEKEARLTKDRARGARRRGGRACELLERRHDALRRVAGRASTSSRCASCTCSPPSRSSTSSTSTRTSWPTTPFKDELRALVAPAEAVFLDAKIESELIELPTTRTPRAARVDRPERARPGPAGPGRLPHARPADLPHRRARRSPAPGRSRSARPRPRRPASSTPTSSAASSRPRSSRFDDLMAAGSMRPPAPPARSASRARTTSCRRRRGGVPLQRLSTKRRTESGRRGGQVRPLSLAGGVGTRSGGAGDDGAVEVLDPCGERHLAG